MGKIKRTSVPDRHRTSIPDSHVKSIPNSPPIPKIKRFLEKLKPKPTKPSPRNMEFSERDNVKLKKPTPPPSSHASLSSDILKESIPYDIFEESAPSDVFEESQQSNFEYLQSAEKYLEACTELINVKLNSS